MAAVVALRATPSPADFQNLSDNALFGFIEFSCLQGLPCVHVHAHDAVLARRALFAGTPKTVEVFPDLNGRESGRLQNVWKLCRRQSTGDSTSPEVDVLAR